MINKSVKSVQVHETVHVKDTYIIIHDTDGNVTSTPLIYIIIVLIKVTEIKYTSKVLNLVCTVLRPVLKRILKDLENEKESKFEK